MRTIQSRFLLRPSPGLNALILGVLGRAQTRYDVEIHAFAFLSNHYHMLVSPADARALAGFMAYVNGNIAREACRLHGWKDKLWARRYQAIVVADEAAQWERLRYIFLQGCKENLVGSPIEWPGVHCAAALSKGTPLQGTWIDRSAAYEASRRKAGMDATSFQTEYLVCLSPLPCAATLSPKAYQERCAAIIAAIEHETAQRHGERGRPLGATAVLLEHPHARHEDTRRSPAPRVHASRRKIRDAFLGAYRWFEALYRAAAEQLRKGARDVVFPEGAFPPPAPFVQESRTSGTWRMHLGEPVAHHLGP